MPGLKAYYNVKITDRNGKLITDKTRESESFVIGFLGLLEGIIRGSAGASTVKDILGSDEDFPDGSNDAGYIFKLAANDDSDTFGIIVGTGNTPPTNTDFVIETKIDHGVAAGELDYNAVGVVAAAEVGDNIDLQVNRSFTNSSGGSITVEEIAIYAQATETGAAAKYLCIIRDVTGGVAVANGQTLTVTYTFRTTV